MKLNLLFSSRQTDKYFFSLKIYTVCNWLRWNHLGTDDDNGTLKFYDNLITNRVSLQPCLKSGEAVTFNLLPLCAVWFLVCNCMLWWFCSTVAIVLYKGRGDEKAFFLIRHTIISFMLGTQEISILFCYHRNCQSLRDISSLFIDKQGHTLTVVTEVV